MEIMIRKIIMVEIITKMEIMVETIMEGIITEMETMVERIREMMVQDIQYSRIYQIILRFMIQNMIIYHNQIMMKAL